MTKKPKHFDRDMHSLFPGYYRLPESDYERLWSNAVFFVDANILLNLYRYPADAREQLLTALERVRSRLCIPHHAALEYQRNRLNVIAEQKSRFDDVRQALTDAKSRVTKRIEELQLRKRHQHLDPDKITRGIGDSIDQFISIIDEHDESQASVMDHDPIRDRIDSLAHGTLGPPYEQDRIKKIAEEGAYRYSLEVPPGFKDASKFDSDKDSRFVDSGIEYDRRYGDLILWNQIIDAASDSNIRDVVLLTDDAKEDWWWIVHAKGPKTIGPRPELKEEIRRKAGVEHFHMYRSEQFLEYSKHYLGTQVAQETIDEVRLATERARRKNREEWEHSIASLANEYYDIDGLRSMRWHEAIDHLDRDRKRPPLPSMSESYLESMAAAWIMTGYPELKIEESYIQGVDLIARGPFDERWGIAIKHAVDARQARRIIRHTTELMEAQIFNDTIDKAVLILVTQDESSAHEIGHEVLHSRRALPASVKVVGGTIRWDDFKSAPAFSAVYMTGDLFQD